MKFNSAKIGRPFSGSTEEEKLELNEKLEKYRSRLNDQWAEIKDDLTEHTKRAAVIGGVVLGVYGLLELLLPDSDDREEPEEEIAPRQAARKRVDTGFTMANALQSILWTVAMGWAKQKITDFVVSDKRSDFERQE